MKYTFSTFAEKAATASGRFTSIRHQMAINLIGCTVNLRSNAQTIAHGVVTGILNDPSGDKLLVGGTPYELSQLLTAIPTSLN